MKHSKKYLVSILILSIQCTLFAQQNLAKKADKLFEAHVYSEAAEIYSAFLQSNYSESQARNLAVCFQQLNAPIDAEYWFAEILKHAPNDSALLLQYAYLLKYNGKYASAKEAFLKYAVFHVDGFYLAGTCDFAMNEKENISILIDTISINSNASEIAPSFFGNGILYASNKQIASKKKSATLKPVQSFYDLYYVENLDSPQPSLFHKNVNSTLHEASASYDNSRNILFFTRSNYLKGREIRSKEKKVHVEIFTASYNDGKWNPIKSVDFNNKHISNGQPCISSDGNILLFVSDMPGGFGGNDIYFSIWENNNWAQPINAGPLINTKGNETYPFFSASGTLYFSSDWHVGFGGYDIFSSSRINDHWSKPENLGMPLNSSRDDFGFILKNGSGYFSSNRIGSKGFDDIYSVRMMQPVSQFYIVDEQTIPLAFVNVKLQEGNHLINVGATDENGIVTFNLEPGKNYSAIIQKAGFKEIVLSNLDKMQSSTGIYPLQMDALMGVDEKIPELQKEIPDPNVNNAQQNTEELFTYELQIGIFEKPDYGRISTLTTFGELSIKNKENGLLSFSIISMISKEKADEAKAAAIKLGYVDAYLIKYKDGVRQQ